MNSCFDLIDPSGGCVLWKVKMYFQDTYDNAVADS